MTIGADLFARLVARLRDEGIPTDPEALADALWLSERMGPPARRPDPPEPRTDQAARDRPAPGAARLAPPAAPRPGRSASGPPAAPVRPAGRDALRLGGPPAEPHPRPLPLERALRPLQGYRPRVPAVRGDLDEYATAEISARSGHITPVFHQVRRREAHLLLVMDDSPSMVVWDRMLEELRQVCQQVGAFRDVSVHYLRPRPDGEAGIAAGPGGFAPLAPADRLRDPTGRTVLLLLSDCSGALWRHGSAQRLLHRFARTGPVAVLQPLPQRMWRRTLLPAEPGLLRGSERPGGRLEFVPRRRRGPERPDGALPVPVLAPTATALGAWARAVAGTPASALDAAAAWVHAGHQGTEPPSSPERDPERLVADFQAACSPAAQHLAVYLSAAPLAYPVMRLVQRAMMPQTGPVEMAEVLLGGLLARDDERPATVPAQRDPAAAPRIGPWYAFAPGVQEVLLRRLGLGEATLVLKHCSLYVERVYGRRARNVPALVVGYLSGSDRDPDPAAAPPGPARSGTPVPGTADAPVPDAFGEVAGRVLRRFQPDGVDRSGLEESGEPAAPAALGGVVIAHRGRVVDTARERLARFQRLGTIRDLWEAVRLLRTVPADDRRPEHTVPLRALLAECLLALWEARRGEEELAEADAGSQAAVRLAERAGLGGVPAGRAHLVRGRVLRAMATAGPAGPATRLLDQAADHLARAERLLRGEPADRLAARTCLVEVAGERHAASGKRRPLLQALARLDEVLASWPPGAPVPARTLTARGGLLSTLAQDAAGRGEAGRARTFARRAVADFAGAAAGRGTPAGPVGEPAGEHARLLLDLAAARAVALDDPGAPEVLADLRRARAAAAENGDLLVETLRRLGRAHAERFARDGAPAELAAADEALALAQRLVPVGEPDRAAVLAERGRVLVDRVACGGGPRAATDAVRVLREALAGTPEGDPRCAGRRLSFGRALRARYAAGGALADLHEAEWVLARAARGATDPATRTGAWREHGDVLLELARATGDRDRLEAAADCYRQAALAAEAVRMWPAAARARHLRGTVLEETEGRQAALACYRAAHLLWLRAGRGGDPAARETRGRIDRLRAGP